MMYTCTLTHSVRMKTKGKDLVMIIDICDSCALEIFPVAVNQFPAEKCEEIKRSEEGEATSGEYWLYSIITGKTVLVSCDMEREGNKTEVFVVLVVDIQR